MTNTYKFGNEVLTLSSQDTEHTIGLIQSELSTYKSIFNVDFKPDDVILDLGANLGIISILLSKKFPFTKIYSFEASIINYNNLVKNINDNRCTNITAFNLAVWSKSDEILEIPTSPTNSGGSSIFYKPEFYQKYPVSKVKTISLPDIFSQNDIKSCKLMKIDVEGSEYEIFKNLTSEYYTKINNLAIEFHRCKAAESFDLRGNLKINNVPIVCEFNAGGSKLV